MLSAAVVIGLLRDEITADIALQTINMTILSEWRLQF